MEALQPIFNDAVGLLHRLTTPHGILASTIEADNYKRIWARDSVVCGFAGILLQDEILIDGLRSSLLTLAKGQHELGMIPSNIFPGDQSDLSYGSLAGRIDANTWFIIGGCLYYMESGDEEAWSELKPAIVKCRKYLKTTEYNNKGWIYTPLSGNWADEYPVHGYTLYDNMLRLWGERLWNDITGEEFPEWDRLLARTKVNFWPNESSNLQLVYHQNAFIRAVDEKPGHHAAFILPGHYDLRFDAAGVALALMHMKTDPGQKNEIKEFLNDMVSELGNSMIPAFWPIINEKSPDWYLLENNYSFSFKNKPGYFHNGGIWPVWMGLFCMGLAEIGFSDHSEQIIADFVSRVSSSDNWDFQEYLNSVDFSFGGKTQMGFTASGIVFMERALSVA